MGSTTFFLPNTLPPGAAALLPQACFAGGYDQTPTPTAINISGSQLVASKGPNESGWLLVPWPVGPLGAYVTPTTTLRERPEPYGLLVELARGKLNQVRTQTAEWRGIGLRTTPEFDRQLGDTTRLFGKAVLNQPSAEADAASIRVLEQSFALADALVRLYIEQMFATRLHDEGKLDTALTARISGIPDGLLAGEYRRAFNSARVGLRWRDLEPIEGHYDWTAADQLVDFAVATGLPISWGPVLDLAPKTLPDWATGWDGDLPTLAAYMCDYLETVIGRYRDRIRRWVICAGFNQSDGLGLTDDDRFRLAARLFEAAFQLDPELELAVSVAQPWGDYMTSEEQTISPLAFADDLIRLEGRIARVELEIRTGILPRGSLPRDLLETFRLLNLFGLLGKPLDLLLSCPAANRPDPVAAHEQCLWAHGWPAGPSPEGQAEWGTSFAALAMCQPHVKAVTWDHWNDRDPHITPNGGLIDDAGEANPLLSRFASLRSAYLA